MATFADVSLFKASRVQHSLWSAKKSKKGEEFIIARVSHDGSYGLAVADGCCNKFSVTVLIRPIGSFDIWCDERHSTMPAKPAGAVDILDRRHSWSIDARGPFDCVKFIVPHSILEDLSDEERACPIERLQSTPIAGDFDPVMQHLAMSVIPAISNPTETNRLFADCIASAATLHIAQKYGGFTARSLFRRESRLAPWQERRAKDFISANLHGNIAVTELAALCGLSPSYFRQAFKATTGIPLHQWLMDRRVEKAKELLANTNASLSEITLATGFADQSHFTRVFSARASASPAAWRRARASQANRFQTDEMSEIAGARAANRLKFNS